MSKYSMTITGHVVFDLRLGSTGRYVDPHTNKIISSELARDYTDKQIAGIESFLISNQKLMYERNKLVGTA